MKFGHKYATESPEYFIQVPRHSRIKFKANPWLKAVDILKQMFVDLYKMNKF